MNFKKNILNLSLALILGTCPTFASKLPDDVWNYIKTSLPKAQQRFDSVVLINNVMYIPLYPPAETTVDAIKVEYSYPAKPLKELPEVVLLNNGYSLLKVFKDEKGNYSLTKKDDLPIKVRLGLMPQDLLTPIGLKMPESLKLTLGDLLIPSKNETTLALKDEEKEKMKSPYAPVVKRQEFIPSVDFKDKKTLLNPKNSKFVSVYDSTNPTPLYELKLSSMPLKIIQSEKSKVALVLYWSGKEAEIISLEDENVITKIQLDANASDAVLNEKENIAYITSQNAGAIYVVDLNSMQLTKVVKLDQRPTKITYCEIDDTISFVDEFSSKVFNITRNENDYIVQPVGEVKNVSKILSDLANIYAISRTENLLYIFDKVEGKLLSTVDLDKKPTDAVIFGTKLFILCAKEGFLDIYDTVEGKLISKEQLIKDSSAFYSKITLMPNNKDILITGINSKNYLLYNLETMKLTKKQESYVDVANIIILEKNQRL